MNIKSLFTSKASLSQDVRHDYWSNVLTGLGAPNSRINSTSYAPASRLDQSILTNIYTSDGLGRRIVNILVDDALRGFIHAETSLLAEMQRLQFKQKIIDSGSWARLYGGSILVAFIDDGNELDEPLNFKTIKKVVSLRSYDRYQVSWGIDDVSDDYYNEHYGMPILYTITPSI
jgi:hypothetical protein